MLPDPDTAIADAAVADMLATGGDRRLDTDPHTGRNRYGCGFRPEEGLLHLGSCTGSTVTVPGFEAAGELLGRIGGADGADPVSTEAEHDRIRRRLTALLIPDDDRVDVVLTPSGTDAEYVTVHLAVGASDRPLLNIVTAPYEVGSGTVPAAGALHFDTLTPNGSTPEAGSPVDHALADRVTTRNVTVRRPDGTTRDADDIDDEMRELVAHGIESGSDVMVHVVAHSKTGMHAPSLDLLAELEQRYDDRLHVVVDAAQGRISRRGLREALAARRLVIVTGSKFYGGPPFAGAVLVPHRYAAVTGAAPPPKGFGDYFTAEQAPAEWEAWRSALPAGGNVGLLLRWEAAITEIERYYAVRPELRFEILQTFANRVPIVLDGVATVQVEESPSPLLTDDAQRLLESKQTVFSFAVRGAPGADRLREVQAHVRRGASEGAGRPVQIGQPVTVAADGESLLRVALGAPALCEYAAAPDPAAAIDEQLHVLITRLEEALR